MSNLGTRQELAGIRAQLQALVDGVGDGSRGRADASVMGQLLNTIIRCLATELEAREQEELVSRLERIEEAMARDANEDGHAA